MRIKPILQAAVFGATLAACGMAFGQAAGSNDALLDLLVKKGIITQDEAGQLQKEAATSPAPEASTAPALSSGAAVPAGAVVSSSGESPTYFNIGSAKFTPVGFMDFTGVYRTASNGGGIGTSFGSIPLSSTSAGQLSETRFSAQNSRLGLKVESQVGDVSVLGYVESDFLGNAAANLNTSSNSATMRMRVYFADLRDGDWEVLAGQDWSLLTPNRRGISPMPSDVFYTMDMDTNYQAGLTWARQAQLRLTYHPTDELAFAVSAEDPDQYVGGSGTVGGGGNIPSTVTSEVDNGSGSSGNSPTAPSEMPDFIGKAAYDTKVNDLAWHFEVSGLLSQYKLNTYNAGTGLNANDTATGSGIELATDLEIIKGLNFVGTAYKSNGGGRYIYGLAPDFTVFQPAGGAAQVSTVKSSSALLGLEWQALANSQLFGYWSAVQIDQDINALYPGQGYGYTGSGQNNRLHEYTVGEVQTLWKSPRYGALQTITQLSYVDRDIWGVTSGPSSAHDSMVFVDLRYVLP